jgi:predicted transcriptional regulator with HTH domain
MVAELEAVELGDNLVFIRRILNKSRVRKDILRLLFEVYPDMSYPAEIARAITTTPRQSAGGPSRC